jgi:putative endonuclease
VRIAVTAFELRRYGMSDWLVYMIRCTDDSLYTGITNNIERRMLQHARLRGARYFRVRRPRELVYIELGHDRSSASKREAQIKSLSRSEKVRLVDSGQNEIAVLGGIRTSLS